MKITLKIILVVLPLLIVALVIGGISSYFIAANGITRVTVEFFEFKTAQLENYVESQWRILVENDLTGRDEMISAAQAGIEVFARSILRSDTEVIFAVDPSGKVVMATSEINLTDAEIKDLLNRRTLGDREFFRTDLGGAERVAMGFPFDPFEWYVVVSEEASTFYSNVSRIMVQTILLVVIGSAVSIALLLFFTRRITKPLRTVVGAMETIISDNDLSARVPVEYRDEIGQMSHTFNLMIGELDKAYGRIKKFAFDAVLAQKRESKIRHIFQKYVPQELIDEFFANPESMLVGKNEDLAILFSDIRSFTTISESMDPDELVNNLNRYFSHMVDPILNRNGVVDKYIGDAIMAFWGAPVKHDDDALSSVLAGLDMMDAVEVFNAEQRKNGKPEFKIGIGINYGRTTVGNIGTDRKMDYTVIADAVNVASRLEGLTKVYKQGILITEMLEEQVRGEVDCRIVDAVAVKGKTEGLKIFTVARTTEGHAELWKRYNAVLDEKYFGRRFEEAVVELKALKSQGLDDYLTQTMLERCERYAETPPPEDWSGVEVMHTK